MYKKRRIKDYDKYITTGLLNFYRATIDNQGYVRTTPKIYKLLAKGGELPKYTLDKIRVVKQIKEVKRDFTIKN